MQLRGGWIPFKKFWSPVPPQLKVQAVSKWISVLGTQPWMYSGLEEALAASSSAQRQAPADNQRRCPASPTPSITRQCRGAGWLPKRVPNYCFGGGRWLVSPEARSVCAVVFRASLQAPRRVPGSQGNEPCNPWSLGPKPNGSVSKQESFLAQIPGNPSPQGCYWPSATAEFS